MTGRLLAELAWVAMRDAEAIADDYAWPPRPPMTDDEIKEYQRLRCLSMTLHRKALDAGCVDQGTDALFGGKE